MIKLDDNLLAELGLASLPPEEKKKMLAHIYETLEMRVGMKLAEQMTDAQLDEFEQFINRNDEAGALRWLESNFPHYKEVVAQEFEKLKAEIKQVAPQILASAQQQTVQGQNQQAPVQQYQQPHYAQQPEQPQYPAQQQQYTQPYPSNAPQHPGQQYPQHQPNQPQYSQPQHNQSHQQYSPQHQPPARSDQQQPPSMPYAA